jgi:hypothetical protein
VDVPGHADHSYFLARDTEGEKMTLLTNELLTELLTARPAPCLSVYQPTHRRHPENKQDPIRFRNLVKELGASLRQRYPEVDGRSLLEPFEALARNEDFWNHTLDGLAVLGGTGIFRAVRLPQPVTELVVAGDSFHTKPLRRFLQSVDRYQVLGLSLHNIRFFEGTRHALDEVDLVPGVPRTITEALGGELTEPRRIVVSHGGHGQGGKADEADNDAERFFRAIDRAVLEHYSRPSGLPLVLAALPEHHDLFHQVSKNPFLVANGISLDPTSISAERLQALAWQTIEPQHQARLAALGEEFKQARSKGLGSGDLAQVATAAASGRVATLLIEADRQIIGRLHAPTGRVELADAHDSKADELLDDLGELTANMGGQVMVIPADLMPVRTGLAATYRH